MQERTFEMPEKPSRSRLEIRDSGTPFSDEIGASVLFVEEAGDVDHGVIVNGGDNIGVLRVVDPRHVLIADAFDAMRAESVFEQGRALQGFACDDLAIGENLLHDNRRWRSSRPNRWRMPCRG